MRDRASAGATWRWVETVGEAGVAEEQEPPQVDVELNLRVLRVLGLWRPAADAPWTRVWAARGAQVLVLSFLSTNIASQIAGVLAAWGDLHTVAMNSCLMFTVMSGLFKVSTFLVQRGRVERLLASLNANLARWGAEEAAERASLMRSAAAKGRDVSIKFLGIGAFALSSFIFAPTAKNILQMRSAAGPLAPASASAGPLAGDASPSPLTEAPYPALDPPLPRNLPTPAWFPFDVTEEFAYRATYVYQSMAIFSIYISTSTLDNLYVSLIIVLSHQLRLLNRCLERVREGAALRLATRDRARAWTLVGTEARAEAKARLDAEADRGLKECIAFHQAIGRCVSELETVISPACLAQFLASVIVICLTAFVVSVATADSEESDIASLTTYVFYLATMFYELFMYCWHGDDLIVESDCFRHAAFSCAWTDASARFRSSVRIAMVRGQRPLRITAFKFYTISRETFLALIQGSYSYFALLRQVNDR